MISNINKTKEILSFYNLNAKKKFGQNFLVDSNIINKICDCADVNKEDTIIEIGPGIGALTEVLCNRAKKVYAFDIDPDMVNILNHELKDCSNLVVFNKDFLDINISDYIKEDNIKVVSNLPYYITTPLLLKLLNEVKVKEIYIMIQLEVASRIIGKCNTKDYGSLSCLVEYMGKANFEFKVTRNCFYPAPNVDSAILSIIKEKRDYKLNNEPNFLKFIQNIFSMRRKTLINNICNNYDIKRDILESILNELNIKLNVRSEELLLDDIYNIYIKLFEE